MSTLNDLMHTALAEQGYTGTVNDQLFEWAADNGGTSGTLNDRIYTALIENGGTSGTINDLWMQVMITLGYTEGSLQDRLKEFWTDGGAFTLGIIEGWSNGENCDESGTVNVRFNKAVTFTDGLVPNGIAISVPGGLGAEGSNDVNFAETADSSTPSTTWTCNLLIGETFVDGSSGLASIFGAGTLLMNAPVVPTLDPLKTYTVSIAIHSTSTTNAGFALRVGGAVINVAYQAPSTVYEVDVTGTDVGTGVFSISATFDSTNSLIISEWSIKEKLVGNNYTISDAQGSGTTDVEYTGVWDTALEAGDEVLLEYDGTGDYIDEATDVDYLVQNYEVADRLLNGYSEDTTNTWSDASNEIKIVSGSIDFSDTTIFRRAYINSTVAKLVEIDYQSSATVGPSGVSIWTGSTSTNEVRCYFSVISATEVQLYFRPRVAGVSGTAVTINRTVPDAFIPFTAVVEEIPTGLRMYFKDDPANFVDLLTVDLPPPANTIAVQAQAGDTLRINSIRVYDDFKEMEADTLTLVNCLDGFLGNMSEHITAQMAALTSGFTGGLDATHDYLVSNNSLPLTPAQTKSLVSFCPPLALDLSGYSSHGTRIDDSPTSNRGEDKGGLHLIAPNMALSANHFGGVLGDTFVWQRQDGNFDSAEIIDLIEVKSLTQGDIQVNLLDSDITGVEIFKILPKGWTDDYAPNISGYNEFDNSFPVLSRRAWRIDNTDSYSTAKVCGLNVKHTDPFTLGLGVTHKDYDGWTSGLVLGDSGQGSYVLINGEAVLLAIHANQTGGYNFSEFIPEINSAMQTLSGDSTAEIGTINMLMFNQETLVAPTVAGVFTIPTMYTNAIASPGTNNVFEGRVDSYELIGSYPEGTTIDGDGSVTLPVDIEPGTWTNLSVQATNEAGAVVCNTATLEVILSPPYMVIAFAPPDGTVGVEYSHDCATTYFFGEKPTLYEIVEGTLPDGLSLNSETGFITGTPTTAGTELGVKLSGTNSSGTSSNDAGDFTIN